MYKLDNLTIIFPSYNCDRSCPFCIAKNNRKFNSDKSVDFDGLVNCLEEFRENGIHFGRIVLSGNGEPSLYSMEELEKCARIIKNNQDLFDALRVHTSGNIFWEKDKFDLFNDLVPDVEFDVLRVAINSERDMQILKYERDYTQTDEFKRAKGIRLDIGLTKELERYTLPEELERLLQEFVEFATHLLSYYGCTSMDDLISKSGKRIIFRKSGSYPKDIVYSDGVIRDYAENPLDILSIKKMAERVDNVNALGYFDRDR